MSDAIFVADRPEAKADETSIRARPTKRQAQGENHTAEVEDLKIKI
jgi:hypothetical protein